MTTNISYMDRDVAIALKEEAQLTGEIETLRQQIIEAQQDLLLSEQTLAVIETSLAGPTKT